MSDSTDASSELTVRKSDKQRSEQTHDHTHKQTDRLSKLWTTTPFLYLRGKQTCRDRASRRVTARPARTRQGRKENRNARETQASNNYTSGRKALQQQRLHARTGSTIWFHSHAPHGMLTTLSKPCVEHLLMDAYQCAEALIKASQAPQMRLMLSKPQKTRENSKEQQQAPITMQTACSPRIVSTLVGNP